MVENLYHPSCKKTSLFAASSAKGAGQALLEKKEGSFSNERFSCHFQERGLTNLSRSLPKLRPFQVYEHGLQLYDDLLQRE